MTTSPIKRRRFDLVHVGYGECRDCGNGQSPPTQTLYRVAGFPEYSRLCMMCAQVRIEEERDIERANLARLKRLREPEGGNEVSHAS